MKALLQQLFNLPADQVEAMFDESGNITAEARQQLIDSDVSRIKTLKETNKAELTQKYDDGYNKGKAEALSKWEKQLRDEFGVQSDSRGSDLVREIVAKNTKVELDDEKVKLHPAYLALEKKLKDEYVPATDFNTVKTEYDKFKQDVEYQGIISVVKQSGLKEFRSLNPVLSSDPARATNQEADFLNKLISNGTEFELQPDGGVIVKQGGKRLETSNGFPVTFAEFVKQEATKYYDFKVQDDKGNAGQKQQPGQQGAFRMPETEQEYIVALANETDPKKAIELMNAWQAKLKK